MTSRSETELPLVGDAPPVTTSTTETTRHQAAPSRISAAFGRAWRVIKPHPTWIPGASTFYGGGVALFYATTAVLSFGALSLGIIGGVGAALIPSEKASKALKEKTIVWIGLFHNIFSTSARLALRGAIAAIPVIGNAIIIGSDLYNKKAADKFFCLFEEIKVFQQDHEKTT